MTEVFPILPGPIRSLWNLAPSRRRFLLVGALRA